MIKSFCLLTCLAAALQLSAQSPASSSGKRSIANANTIAIEPGDSPEQIIAKAVHVVPTANQYAALKKEFIAFIHFGPNSFTRMEWGTGKEDPHIFDLKELDTDQWCAAMKAAGMKMVILTAKHHDGFVLWQSRYTDHGIMSTGFQKGKGDIIKDLSASCRKSGLRLGIYLSPADLFQIENEKGLYGNGSSYTKRTIPRSVPGRPFANKNTFDFVVDDYNEYFLNQLFELLTEYGPVDEVWFDGAHPKRKGNQQYNYTAWKKLIRTLAPQAVIFGKEDIRWCGNESGRTRTTEWNVIPYEDDPRTAIHFPDLEAESLGSLAELEKGKFLHYQQAETNTSIREGWFYRDDSLQQVRNADDVFDIYERSVGGNSTFLLNIPPNRNGKFSPEDVGVLKEVGERIRVTYGTDLLAGAKGAAAVLDNSDKTFQLLPASKPQEMVITTATPVTINRLVIQEAITSYSERVAKHALDAWIDNNWKEIAAATNIGYKRILRFPETTSAKFRIRILESRATPAISKISAHYYKTRPPQLGITRNSNGLINISPLQQAFGWKPHGENAAKNLAGDYEIRYTTDGSEPGSNTSLFSQPFENNGGEIRAIAISTGKNKGEKGAVARRSFGLISKNWKLVKVDSETDKHPGNAAFDNDPKTWWLSAGGNQHFIVIDLGAGNSLSGFAYTPPVGSSKGLLEKGRLQFSDDGNTWSQPLEFSFGNLVNDPTTRRFNFPAAANARYVRLECLAAAANDDSFSIAELEFFSQ
ncbi:alpha-L-fucosidase [Flavihumibacter petaseus]|uniref:alpha-L-fucosidase n=1 Tax=Flavihumibacter petaseus NBRC 106054 TaxID=1220578 RepID=A0A0E9N1D8_9BACT|nr:alpha-L-fucosidase [Flavihumibacter petaseus]GAO43857.1 putative alpha-L-fucosidase [Flavihumibacter petaseus NBRC 106054]